MGKKNKRQWMGIQRKIVALMTSESWRNIPHVSYIFEPDLSAFLDRFDEFNDEIEKEGKHVTVNTVIIKAICEALKSAPKMNAHVHYNVSYARGTYTTCETINVSMPWVLPDGKMMTLAMNDMGNRSLGDMTEYMNETSRRIKNTNFSEVMYNVALDNTLGLLKKGKILSVLRRLYGYYTVKWQMPDKPLEGKEKKEYYKIPEKDRIVEKDLKRGTITISNIGATTREHSGTLAMLMIIPPMVCAIGIGAVQKIPRVVTVDGEDKIVASKTIPLCLCFDHRVLDFGDVRPFIDALQNIFDDPSSILKY